MYTSQITYKLAWMISRWMIENVCEMKRRSLVNTGDRDSHWRMCIFYIILFILSIITTHDSVLWPHTKRPHTTSLVMEKCTGGTNYGQVCYTESQLRTMLSMLSTNYKAYQDIPPLSLSLSRPLYIYIYIYNTMATSGGRNVNTGKRMRPRLKFKYIG